MLEGVQVGTVASTSRSMVFGDGERREDGRTPGCGSGITVKTTPAASQVVEQMLCEECGAAARLRRRPRSWKCPHANGAATFSGWGRHDGREVRAPRVGGVRAAGLNRVPPVIPSRRVKIAGSPGGGRRLAHGAFVLADAGGGSHLRGGGGGWR